MAEPRFERTEDRDGRHGVPWRFVGPGILLLALLVAAGLWFGDALGLQPGNLARLEQATPTASPTPSAAATSTPLPAQTVTPTYLPTQTPTSTPTNTPTSTLTPTPTPIVVITGLNSLGRLETARFAMQTIVNLEDTPQSLLGRLAGSDKLLLVAQGEVVAGFDLSQVQPGDIVVHGTAVTLTLPPPEILYSRVDNDKTYVYERQTGLLRHPDPNLETEARRLAEQRLRDWALEQGIMAQANKFGLMYLEGFLRSLGLTQIQIKVR